MHASSCAFRERTPPRVLFVNARLLISGAAVAVLIATGPAGPASAAPDYPSKPIRLLVPGAAGSPPDTVARSVGERLAALGQPVIVENRPGAVGTLALSAVARAAPDGHTLGIIGLPHLVAPGLLRVMPYDTERDLVPIVQLVRTANVLVVPPSSPVKTVDDLIALAKSKPGLVTFASAGNGTPSHLAFELFRQHAGIDAIHVPFKGIPAAFSALMGEQVDVTFSGIAAALPLIKTARLRALGTAAAARLPVLPELPTIAELGLPGFQLEEWYGLATTAGTPAEVIDKIASEVARILAMPEIRARLESLGLSPIDKSGPESFAKMIRADLPRWTQFVRGAGIRSE